VGPLFKKGGVGPSVSSMVVVWFGSYLVWGLDRAPRSGARWYARWL